MANVTAKQLSEVIGVSVDKLLDQLKSAGVEVSGENDPISDEDKLKLLGHCAAAMARKSLPGRRRLPCAAKVKANSG